MALTIVNGTRDAPRCKPGDLKPPEYERRIWRHVVPPEVDWHLALTREYWVEALPKLAAGDRIEVCTSDFEVCIELWVQEVVSLAEHIRFIARPLFPHDLVVPAVTAGEEPRYFPRQGGDRLWDVVDRVTGEIQKTRVSRGVADSECEVRNRADADARALVAASAARAAGEPVTEAEVTEAPEPQVAVPVDGVRDSVVDREIAGEAMRASADLSVAAQLAALGRAAEEKGAA